MDRDPTSPSRERAASSEPCSTRPNPFNETDLSARKRRRTSMSGASRSRSVDTVKSAKDFSEPANEDAAMKIDTDPTTPQTPDGRPELEAPPSSGPVSSRVTINLRSAQRPLDTIPSSPVSPQSPTPASRSPRAEGDVKVSVEESETDVPPRDAAEGTPVSSDTGSPPVEVIDVQPDEDTDYESNQVTLIQGMPGGLVEDPSEEFPFRMASESWQDTIQKLTNYVATHEEITKELTAWMDKYLRYAKTIGHAAATGSFYRYRNLWVALPDLLWCTQNLRLPGFGTGDRERDRSLRRAITDFCASFGRLTAYFVDFDVKTLTQSAAQDNGRVPELASPSFLLSLNLVTRREQARRDEARSVVVHDRDEVTEIVEHFIACHKGPGGAFGPLYKLIEMQIDLIPRCPKIVDYFHQICPMVVVIMRETEKKLHTTTLPLAAADQARARLIMGLHFFKRVAAALSMVIDKHVTCLNYENAQTQISSLSDIAQASLRADHPAAAKILADQQKKYPLIPLEHLPEVFAMEWRFTTFRTLIMSSQMQLRVMAVSNLSQDLVSCFKKFGEAPHDIARGKLVVQFVSDFLVSSGLVAYLLGPTCHPEITVESSNIIGFLAVTRTYRDEHSDLLWQTVTSTQDPRISDALIRMAGRVVSLWSCGDLVYLCQKLLALPIEAFGTAMREFVDNLFRNIIQKAANERIPVDAVAFSLCLRLLRESSVFGSRSPTAYPDIQAFANEKLSELLRGGGLGSDGRQEFAKNCLDDIRSKSPTTLGSLWALSIFARQTLWRELQVLVAEHDLTTLLVDELENAIAVGQAAGFPQVISGTANVPRRDVICSIIMNYASTITADLGSRLWKMLVGESAACQEDQDASWKVLNSCLKKRNGPDNSFLAACFSEFLPALPPERFCEGLLEFVREALLPLVNDASSILLDDESADKEGIEQLWRIVLTAPSQTIERQAITTLVNDIYIDSKSVLSFSLHRARKVHLALVTRCLEQLSSAAARLKSFSDGTVSGDDEAMVVVAAEPQLQEQELLFIRSLSVLREFLRLYRAKAHFAAPDLRSLILASPNDVEGESAELKFQPFDGNSRGDVQPLNIGRRNTAASLLASLKEATGFDNYRMYYRGQAFVPHEGDICKSLEDLRIHNGLILVKREELDAASSSVRIRPGMSPVEIEVLNHFEELWDYLSMEDRLAQEIYYFLIRLPVDEHVLRAFQTDSLSHKEIFPPGHPFKSLYAIYALREYLSSRRQIAAPGPGRADQPAASEYAEAWTRALALTVAAICDHGVVHRCTSQELQLSLSTTLIDSLFEILRDPLRPGSAVQGLGAPLLERLLEIQSIAMAAQPTEASARLVLLTFQAILECCSRGREFWIAFQNHEATRDLVCSLLVNDWRQGVRNGTAKLVGEKSFNSGSDVVPASDFLEFFWLLVLSLIPAAIREPSKCDETFNLSFTMFKLLRGTKSPVLDMQELLTQMCKLLLAHTPDEDITQPERKDLVAQGLARMLHAILSCADCSLDLGISVPNGFSRTVFWKQLFPPWAEDEGLLPRVVLTPSTRTFLIQIIFSLLGDSLSRLMALVADLDALVPFEVRDEDDPYHYELPPQFDRAKAVRASCGYAGLRNLSNTCYLNSLLTQLFMNTGFRHFMMNAEIREEGHSQRLLFQTRLLFGFLQDSIRRFIDPQGCVATIKTFDDVLIDIHNQMDVDEFYQLLFERWEQQLVSPDAKKKLRSFYSGQLVQQVRSQECDHVSERLEPFSAIQCDIKGKASLQESLQAYVDGEIMEGDNKYKCSTCDRHVNAVKRACLKDIPDHLIFHLKRFDFNLKTLQRNKINDYFAFPQKIDMRPYTIDQLSSPTEEKSADVFELVGVLVHSGTAESGHYYSYIRERPTTKDGEVWVEFNDDLVSPWDPTQIESSCFGGPDYRSHFDSTSLLLEKSYSAYMLFYQRSSSLGKEQAALMRSGQPSPLRVTMPEDMEGHIRGENNSLLRRHCLYDPAQIQFVSGVLAHVKTVGHGQCSPEHKLEDCAVHMALGHLDQVASRTKDIPEFSNLLGRILAFCQSCARCCLAVYEYFSYRPEALRSLVQRSVEPLVRQESGALVIRALQGIRQAYPGQYGIPCDDDAGSVSDVDMYEQTVVRGAVVMMHNLWLHFHGLLRSWNETFGFMLAYVRLGRHEMAAFLDQDYFHRTALAISADTGVSLDAQYSRLVTNLHRRMPSRPPAWENVISLVDAMLSAMRVRYSAHGAPIPPRRATRLEAALRDPDEPLEMTEDEYNLLGRDWNGGFGNIFIDRLITLNANPEATESIIGRLLEIYRGMDDKIELTLRANITSQASTHYNMPFLRAALVFCRKSTKPHLVQGLIRHVAAQCKGLGNSEGRSFFEFHRDVFHGRGSGGVDVDPEALMRGLGNLPLWAPGLLGYYDTSLSNEVEVFLQENLFAYGTSPTFGENEGGDGRAEALRAAARQLGVECLAYLKDFVVGRNVHIGNHLVAGLQRVASQCKEYYGGLDDDDEDGMAEEYINLSQSVDEPLNRLVVKEAEEADDDGSDQGWDASDCSSEPMGSPEDTNMHATGDEADLR